MLQEIVDTIFYAFMETEYTKAEYDRLEALTEVYR